jgi:hypothetical protein
MGVLATHRISPAEVYAIQWKTQMELRGQSKDISRAMAATFFPSLSKVLACGTAHTHRCTCTAQGTMPHEIMIHPGLEHACEASWSCWYRVRCTHVRFAALCRRKKDHGRAEGLLLAAWAAMMLDTHQAKQAANLEDVQSKRALTPHRRLKRCSIAERQHAQLSALM